jgi:hypothetical protein
MAAERPDTPGAAVPASPAPGGVCAWLLTGVLGVGGILFLAFFVHWYEISLFSDRGASYTQVIVNALAPLVLFLVMGVVLPLNAVLRRSRWRLHRPHLTLIVALWLLTGAISFTYLTIPVLHTAGQTFHSAYRTKVVETTGVLQQLNPRLFLSPEAAAEYYNGLRPANQGTWPAQWRAIWQDFAWQDGLWATTQDAVARLWRCVANPARQQWAHVGAVTQRLVGPWRHVLLYWLPAMLLMVLMSQALVRMVQRQWSRHELLTYPVADFADALLAAQPGRAWPRLFYDPVFWCGFAITAFIYGLNGLSKWVPQVVNVPLSFSHMDLLKEFPFLSKYCGRESYSMFRGMVYPAIVAIAVLLPAEVSLTAWAGWVLMILGTGIYFLFTGEAIGPAQTSYINVGSFVALLAMLAYIGRREYWAILRHACRPRLPEDPELRPAVHACRLFVLCAAGLWTLLLVAGFDWLLALVLVATFALLLLLAARMTAEMGCPWLTNLTGLASGLPLKLLGVGFFGPKGLVLFHVLGAVLTADMANSVAAQETTIGRLQEQAGVRRRWGFTLAITGGVVLAVLACSYFALHLNYATGAQRETWRGTALRGSLTTPAGEIDRLRTQGKLAELEGVHGAQRLGHLEPPRHFWRYFALGIILIGGCAVLRLRYTWWPFHPLPLLFFGSWAMSRLFFSFLLGWLIKVAILRVGGGKVFARLKPLFIGIVCGQIATGGFWLLVNVIYYLIHGEIDPDKTLNFFI